jgi:hypothetical protein
MEPTSGVFSRLFGDKITDAFVQPRRRREKTYMLFEKVISVTFQPHAADLC